MEVAVFCVGQLDTNCYVVHNAGEAIVIDPGGKMKKILAYLEKNKLTVIRILNTHLHFDHTYGNAELADLYKVPILAGAGEAQIDNSPLTEGGIYGLPGVAPYAWEVLEPGEYEWLGAIWRVLPTPGHSPGSLTFYVPELKAAFVGDLIFRQSVGRTDFPGGSSAVLVKSVKEHIFTLPPDTVLYSGHGPQTGVAEEMRKNPYIPKD